ncbi:MAG: hypothetical protein ACRDV8_07090, partial [Acidimicrobiales bacterium]
LVSRSMQETVKAGSFRYVETSTALGNPDDISGDAGPSSGRQVIKVNCKTGTNIFDLRLVRGVVYFRGNAPAVTDQLGVAQAKAASEADLWVRVVRGEKPYQSFAVGITARSNISQIRTMFVPSFSRPAARTTPPSTAIFGQLAYGKGRPPVGEARYVVGTSSALPRSFDAVTTTTVGRSTQTWTFERFGEHLDVAVPSGAVPYASLHASTPSKGSCA